jgi:hypothetical protein
MRFQSGSKALYYVNSKASLDVLTSETIFEAYTVVKFPFDPRPVGRQIQALMWSRARKGIWKGRMSSVCSE